MKLEEAIQFIEKIVQEHKDRQVVLCPSAEQLALYNEKCDAAINAIKMSQDLNGVYLASAKELWKG